MTPSRCAARASGAPRSRRERTSSAGCRPSRAARFRRGVRRRRRCRCVPSSNISGGAASRAGRAPASRPCARPRPVAAGQASTREAATAARPSASPRSTAAASRDAHRRPPRRPADRRAVTIRSEPTSRTSKPGSPLEVDGRRRRVAARGNEREMRQPEPAEHVADHVAQLAVARARAAARGPSSAVTAGQSRPFIGRIEVRVADDRPGGVERLGRFRRLRTAALRRQPDTRPRRAASAARTGAPRPGHLMSALICGGSAKTDGIDRAVLERR